MSEELVSRDEAKLASTLFYGLMGGFAGAGSCCCWPVSVGIAWLATRRAVERGTIAPGEGVGYGAGLGVVMGLVMSTLGTALALSNLEEPQGEVVAAMLAETPLWLVAVVAVGMLGAIGFVSGLLGGLLGGGGRQRPERSASSSVVVRPDVPVPGAMGADELTEDIGERPVSPEGVSDPSVNPEGESDQSVNPEGVSDQSVNPEGVSDQSVNPEDFVTAVSEPSPSWPSVDLRPVIDVERTVTIDQDPVEGGKETEDEEEPEED